MVRKIDIATTLEGSAQAIWQAVYADAGPAKAYHARVNSDPNAEVGNWQEGVRHIMFCMPLAAPDWVKRLAPIESVRVRETQMVLWHSSRSFTVRSDTTVLNVPGATRFQTSLNLAVTQRIEPAQTTTTTTAAAAPDGPGFSPRAEGPNAAQDTDASCDVVFTVRCSAGMPWPLSGSIENLMAEKAQISMQGYLNYCQELIDAMNDTVDVGGAGVGGGGDKEGLGVGGVLPGAKRSSHPGAGGLDDMRMHSRCFRWPSVAVSTFPQGMDELLPGLPELESPGEGGLSPGGDATSGFQDVTEMWLSPAASFTGIMSDSEGHAASVVQRHNRNRSVAVPGSGGGPTQEMVMSAVQNLATAIQALDKKVQYLTGNLPTSPEVVRANRRAWGAGSPRRNSSRELGDGRGTYLALPGGEGDVEAGTGTGGSSRGCWGMCCPTAFCLVRSVWFLGRVGSVLLMLAGVWFLVLLVMGKVGPMGPALSPPTPTPTGL